MKRLFKHISYYFDLFRLSFVIGYLWANFPNTDLAEYVSNYREKFKEYHNERHL